MWLNNSRGNRFSRHHRHYDPGSNHKFWAFSFQDMADYDLPALFTFVLNHTKQTKVIFIGHSQGTMQMFTALADNLEFFASKLILAIMMAPATRITENSLSSNYLFKKVADSPTAMKAAHSYLRSQGPELFAQA